MSAPLLALFAVGVPRRDQRPFSVPAADTGFAAVPGGRVFYEGIRARPTGVLLHRGNLDYPIWGPQLAGPPPPLCVLRHASPGLRRLRPSDTTLATHTPL